MTTPSLTINPVKFILLWYLSWSFYTTIYAAHCDIYALNNNAHAQSSNYATVCMPISITGSSTPSSGDPRKHARDILDQVRGMRSQQYYCPSEQELLAYVCQPWSHYAYAAYFDNLLQQNKTTKQKIVRMYDLYRYSAFLSYIGTWPEFEDHILALYQEMQSGSKAKKAMAKRMGYDESTLVRFLEHNATEVKRLQQARAAIERAAAAEQKKIAAQKHAEQIALAAQQEKKRKEAEAHQASIQQYTNIDVSQTCIRAFERNGDRNAAAMSIHSIMDEVLNGASICDYQVIPEVKEHMEHIVSTIPSTDNQYSFAFKVVMAEQVLYDMQREAVTHAQLSPITFERARNLFTQAACTFVKRLNPITQVKSWASLAIDTARFISTISVGQYYLSPEEYQARVNGYWDTVEAFSPKNLAQMNLEQWVDFGAHIAADMVFCAGAAKTISYIKQLNTVVKTRERAATFAKRFREAAQQIMEPQPVATTPEGVLCRMAEEAQAIGGGAQKAARVLDETLSTLQQDWLYTVLRDWEPIQKTVHGVYEGMGTFAHKCVKLDFPHIFGMEFSLCKKGLVKLGGFHLDIMNLIEKSGIFEFRNRIPHPNGCYTATLYYKGQRIKEITFFPAHWSRQEAVDAILGVYKKHAKKLKDEGIIPTLNREGKYTIRGLAKEAVEIEMHICQNGIIKTAYPVLQRPEELISSILT